jgi:hypothetical protein
MVTGSQIAAAALLAVALAGCGDSYTRDDIVKARVDKATIYGCEIGLFGVRTMQEHWAISSKTEESALDSCEYAVKMRMGSDDWKPSLP